MNKREFLGRLGELLSDLSAGEREEALLYYEEYFADAGEENEAEVLASLGSPEQVAEQIKEGLGKSQEGLFTENGYRASVENENPPDLGGRQKGRERYGSNRNAGRAEAGKKEKNKMSGATIAVIVILAILASPMILGLGAGLLGITIGILAVILAVVLVAGLLVISFLIVGISLLVSGFGMLLVKPFAGILFLGLGCLMIAVFLLFLAVLVMIFGKFFPWLIKEVESFGKYLKRKWNGRRKGGKAA